MRILFSTINPDWDTNANLLYILPSKIFLGEVTNKYYAFLTSLQLLYNFNTDCIYDKQLDSLPCLQVGSAFLYRKKILCVISA